MSFTPGDPFYSDIPQQDLRLQANQTLPGSEGGLIESTKRAIVTGVREQITRTGLSFRGRGVYVDLEYPLEEQQYPGIWVQFNISKFTRGGVSHETVYWDPDQDLWIPIQVWTFEGRVTLSIVALHNKDRDQISDAVLTMLAFARPPESWVTQPDQDTKQYRALITSINTNPYVSFTMNTDVLHSSSQGVEIGTPWQQDTLAYTDAWSFDLHGQTQVRFLNDGAYTLSRIDIESTPVTSVPEEFAPIQPPPPPLGRGASNQTYRTL